MVFPHSSKLRSYSVFFVGRILQDRESPCQQAQSSVYKDIGERRSRSMRYTHSAVYYLYSTTLEAHPCCRHSDTLEVAISKDSNSMKSQPFVFSKTHADGKVSQDFLSTSAQGLLNFCRDIFQHCKQLSAKPPIQGD